MLCLLCPLDLPYVIELNVKFGFTQCIESSTHMHGNTLDLVFVNNEYLHHHSNCLEVSQSVSHHKIVEVYSTIPLDTKVKQQTPPPYEGMHKFNFFDANIEWDKVNTAFDCYDWEEEFSGLNIDDMAEKFIEVSEKICSSHIPEKSVSSNNKKKIPRDRKILMRRRRKLNAKLCDFNISLQRKASLRKMLVQVEKDLLCSHFNSQSKKEKKAVESIKKNKKCFFSYVNELSKAVSKIGPLMTKENKLVSDPKDMAEMLSDQFCSVFTPQSGPILDAKEVFPESAVEHPSMFLGDILFGKEDIVKAIKELSPHSASGPKGYSPAMLRNCAQSVSHPLFLIYRRSLDEGKVTKCFKIGM